MSSEYKWINENVAHFLYYFPYKLNTMFKANTRYAKTTRKYRIF